MLCGQNRTRCELSGCSYVPPFCLSQSLRSHCISKFVCQIRAQRRDVFMGVRFRKSVNFGPFRMTVSKSGVSTSFGVKGARITKTSSGKVRTTVSIPETGISHVEEMKIEKNSPPRKGRTWIPVVGGVLALVVGLWAFAQSGNHHAEKPVQPAQEAVESEESNTPPKLDDEQKQLFADAADGLLSDGVVSVAAYYETRNIEVAVKSDQLDAAVKAAGDAAPDGWDELKSAAAEVSADLLSQAQDAGYKRSYLQLVSNVDGEIYATCFNGKVSYDKFTEKTVSNQAALNSDKIVWVSKSGSRYHYDSSCGGHEYTQTTKSAAIAAGLTACQKCANGG